LGSNSRRLSAPPSYNSAACVHLIDLPPVGVQFVEPLYEGRHATLFIELLVDVVGAYEPAPR
jgi:hypothetical protein